MTTEAWFVKSNVSFDISCVELDVIDELNGVENSMWDIISFMWEKKDSPFLQSIAAPIDGFEATPAGTTALWKASISCPLRDRIAAQILHQLLYMHEVAICYDWYALIWADRFRQGQMPGDYWMGWQPQT